MTETNGEMLTRLGTDAHKWAQEFMSRGVIIDEGTMISWFASAIETGRTAGQSTPIRTEHLTQMIQRQLGFQRRLGFDFAAMSTRDRVDYVKQMYVAAVKELSEALDEVSWKNWAKGEYVHEGPLLGELTDVTCFLLNLYFVTCPDLNSTELAHVINAAHETKTAINIQRQETGYDGVANKCPQCHRALDDPAVECETGTDGYHCAYTDTTYLNDTRS